MNLLKSKTVYFSVNFFFKVTSKYQVVNLIIIFIVLKTAQSKSEIKCQDIYSSHVDNIPKAHICLTKTATFKAEPDIDENLQNKFSVHKILYYFKVHILSTIGWVDREKAMI